MNALMQWVGNMTWINMVIWYILITLGSFVAVANGIHHVSLVWIPFTILILVKLKINPTDNYIIRKQ